MKLLRCSCGCHWFKKTRDAFASSQRRPHTLPYRMNTCVATQSYPWHRFTWRGPSGSDSDRETPSSDFEDSWGSLTLLRGCGRRRGFEKSVERDWGLWVFRAGLHSAVNLGLPGGTLLVSVIVLLFRASPAPSKEEHLIASPKKTIPASMLCGE